MPYRLLDGSELGSIANGTIQNLDYAPVRNEQVYVQGQLDRLPNATRQNLIQQSNRILNDDFYNTSEIRSVIKKLGRDLDFGKIEDRVLIGHALVDANARLRGQ